MVQTPDIPDADWNRVEDEMAERILNGWVTGARMRFKRGFLAGRGCTFSGEAELFVANRGDGTYGALGVRYLVVPDSLTGIPPSAVDRGRVRVHPGALELEMSA